MGTPNAAARRRAFLKKLLGSALFACAAAAAATAGAATVTVSVTDAAGNALPDAVVYAMPISGKAPMKPAASALIDQVKREFVPLVSVMQTGTMVSFPNKDNIRHSVYSFSPAKTFEVRLYSGEKAPAITFDKPGLVTMGCNIHDQMIAYALVVDTPWFGKTDTAGKTVVDGFPPGEYDMYAWHHRQTSASPVSQRLSVKSAGKGELSFRIDLKADK